MANLFQKLFGLQQPAARPALSPADAAGYRKQKQEKVEALRPLIAETLALYNATACPCAFPRFRQIAGIDCVDYGAAFYATETELMIAASKPFYEQRAHGHPAANVQEWTCKTCGSLWYAGWQDFSISLSRNVLWCKTLRAADAGAPPHTPVPLYAGLSGYNFPGKTKIVPVGFDEFKTYLQAMA